MKSIELRQSDILKIVNLVLEQDEDLEYEQYEHLDYIHVFARVFKNWIEKTKQIKFSDYPFSFLLKKYGKEFLNKHDLSDDEDADEADWEDYYFSTHAIQILGKEMLKRGFVNYPSLREQGTFLKRFGRALEKLKSSIELPEYVNVEFSEPQPFVLDTKVNIDFDKALKSDDSFRFEKYSFEEKISKIIRDFIGIDIGSPVMGKLRVRTPVVDYVGQEEFVKNILNKKIKTEIRKHNNSNVLQRIRFDVESGPRAELKLIFKDFTSWDQRREMKDLAQSVIDDLGFSTKKFKVIG